MEPILAVINRFALVTKPKPALIQWVNSIYPADPVDIQDLEGHDNLDVFLIPEFTDLEDAEEWLKENYSPILEYLLENWCTDRSAWPAIVDWDLFETFFHYSIDSMVIDTMDEEYDEEE
ncbi:MAG: hypothetical protein GYB31_20830 [Bacteroidetes bacterium]|nr:hypothetical protein [Bacteroidota bacterium]